MEEKKRYQECNLMVKLYRRIRYQIPCIISSVFITIKSIFDKNRRYPLYFIYACLSQDWTTYDQGCYYYTIEETRERLGLSNNQGE